MEKVKVSKEVAEAITRARAVSRDADILYAHKFGKAAWKYPLQVLNTMDYGTLKRALEDGYEVETHLKITDFSKLKVGMPVKYILAGREHDGFIEEIDHADSSVDLGAIWLYWSHYGSKWWVLTDVQRPTPKTPRQMHPIIALAHKEKQQSTAEELQAELDYELASLSHALSNDDAAEVERSKQRLSEIHEELYPQVLEGF